MILKPLNRCSRCSHLWENYERNLKLFLQLVWSAIKVLDTILHTCTHTCTRKYTCIYYPPTHTPFIVQWVQYYLQVIKHQSHSLSNLDISTKKILPLQINNANWQKKNDYKWRRSSASENENPFSNPTSDKIGLVLRRT